jgi:hypothetical protein
MISHKIIYGVGIKRAARHAVAQAGKATGVPNILQAVTQAAYSSGPAKDPLRLERTKIVTPGIAILLILRAISGKDRENLAAIPLRLTLGSEFQTLNSVLFLTLRDILDLHGFQNF